MKTEKKKKNRTRHLSILHLLLLRSSKNSTKRPFPEKSANMFGLTFEPNRREDHSVILPEADNNCYSHKSLNILIKGNNCVCDLFVGKIESVKLQK